MVMFRTYILSSDYVYYAQTLGADKQLSQL